MNQSEESIVLDFSLVCTSTRSSTKSPIDQYYDQARALLLRAATSGITSDEVVMRLLALELVSSAEMYFRSILAGLLGVCPLVKAVALQRQLSLGSVEYYPHGLLGLGLVEGVSLSGEGELRRQTQHLTGFEIKPQSSVGVALSDFDKICHLRHAVVHARGELGMRNANELGLSLARRHRVKLDVIGLQAIAVKVQNAVRAYNTFLFENVLRGWLSKKVLSGKWQRDRVRFSTLHALFYSRYDRASDPNPRDSFDQLRPIIK